MDDNLVARIQREIDLGYGDNRLRFILNWVKSGRPLFECDKKYLATRLIHYAETEKRHERRAETIAKLEHQVKNIEEDVKDDLVTRDFQDHTPEISDVSDDKSARAANQVDVIVNMRKDLHHILIKLDELEEKFRRPAQYQEPRREVRRRETRSTVYDIQQEKPSHIASMSQEEISNVLDMTAERPHEKKEEPPKVKEIRKDIRGLRAFATGLFCITVVTIGIFFVFTLLFGIPAGKEKLEQFGITYDQFRSTLNWLVPGFVMYLGAWAVFGILYLQSTKNKQN
ncbi:MAG: hypothetical protein E6K83_07935 [Thaumarchaeota archaeon]|nr:MAG: hypothetical protein E6K83_07935 [Nitrososphaerota archaeon]